MNYFPATIGSEKVTIDGVKVKDKMGLVSATAPSVKLADLPYKYSRGCAVVFNGEIHILGNVQDENYYTHYKWDGNTWTEVSTLPYPFYDGCAIVYEGAIHILGASASDYNRNHYKWDGTVWTQLPNIPYDFWYGGVAEYSGGIHIFGGSGNAYNHYKWYNGAWTAMVSCPINFTNGAVANYGGNVYLFSGLNRVALISDNSWGSSSSTGIDSAGARAVTMSDGLHLLGGSGSPTQNYIILQGKQKPALPYKFVSGSAVVLNGKIHLLGGSLVGGNYPYQSYPTNHYVLDADILFDINS